jgi:hypothetical protein
MGASFQQWRQEDEYRFRYNCARFCMYGLLTLIALAFFVLMYLVVTEPPPPRYSVAIGAVSGLDPDTDLQEGRALDPAFNLTVHIDASLSGNGESAYCLDKSTSVQVSYSYLCVPLAGGRVPEPGTGTCAAPGSRRDLGIFARWRGVVVPGFLLDSLAEDMRRGEAVFEVTLMSPKRGGWNVMTCWGEAGDDTTLEVPCVRSWVPVLQPGGNVPVPWPWPGRRRARWFTM